MSSAPKKGTRRWQRRSKVTEHEPAQVSSASESVRESQRGLFDEPASASSSDAKTNEKPIAPVEAARHSDTKRTETTFTAATKTPSPPGPLARQLPIQPNVPKNAGGKEVREAWQIPFAEWKKLRDELRECGDNEGLSAIGGLGTDFAHRFKVKLAIEQGKAIPLEVLKDYPDLAKPE